ncbi:unnamed protein product, partial [Medioppia subpectinata]
MSMIIFMIIGITAIYGDHPLIDDMMSYVGDKTLIGYPLSARRESRISVRVSLMRPLVAISFALMLAIFYPFCIYLLVMQTICHVTVIMITNVTIVSVLFAITAAEFFVAKPRVSPCGKSIATQVPVTSPDHHILTANKHGVLTITLNRPEGRNALTPKMYENFSKALRSAATNDTVTMAMITGTGKYFSTGNDLGNWLNPQPGTNSDMSEISELISSLIDFPKPLIGAVNGPAIGIGVTAIALMDTMVASDAAYFHTPFTSLGLTAEGCSSYTLPKIMGTSLASDMLLFGRKLTAAEALQSGLVARVIPGAEFSSWVEKWVFDGTTGLIN